MDSSKAVQGLKDNRVPTFITFESQDKQPVKRKRASKSENGPNKRSPVKKARKVRRVKLRVSSPKEESEESSSVEEVSVNQIWIGASTDENKGAYSVYFGENDERNYIEAFEKETDLQDVDYAYGLGISKALEVTQPSNSPILIHVSSRNIARAIREKKPDPQYSPLIDKINTLLFNREETQVRHISGRNPPDQQKEAINLAMNALKNSDQPNKQVEEAGKQTSTTIEMTEVADVIIEKEVNSAEETGDIIPSTDDLQANVEETAEKTAEETVEETVEEVVEEVVVVETTVVETKVEPEEAQPMELVEEEQVSPEAEAEAEAEAEPAPAPASWLAIRNIFNILSGPFRSRKPQ